MYYVQHFDIDSEEICWSTKMKTEMTVVQGYLQYLFEPGTKKELK